jgi:hypothetical protein
MAGMVMRRLIYPGAVALIASAVFAGSVSADAAAASFGFKYVHSYGRHGLSRPYGGPTSTGQSYGTGVAIQASDPSQKVYSLVEANPNVGVGGVRGAFPAASRTVSGSSSTSGYLGPYYLLRRTNHGNVDRTFAAGGYVGTFGNSTDRDYKFTSLCIDPGTGDIVIVGQHATSSAPVGVVERLLPPARGSGTASLDTSFNPHGSTPGMVAVSTPNGNNSPTLYGCSVIDEGAGHSGAILVGGVDDAASSSLVVAAKISSSGGYDAIFGSNGVVEYTVQRVAGSGPSAEITNVSLSGAHSDFPDVILSGFSFTKATMAGSSAKATALTVAVKDRTGALDTNVNGSGELINPNYGEAVLGRVDSTRAGKMGGTARDLYVAYGTVGTDAAAFVDYPITRGVPDTAHPARVKTATFTVPRDFAAMQGYTFNSGGQIVVSGDTTANAEMLSEIRGSRALGY